ncbi:DUF2391 family protein [Candidatus Woesearchaeota archaeon]|nr:DUF2391 family protein [Candidatus Woesearchaeota archaeon]
MPKKRKDPKTRNIVKPGKLKSRRYSPNKPVSRVSKLKSEVDAILKDEDSIKQELEGLEVKESRLEKGEDELKKGEARIEAEEEKVEEEEKKIEEEARKIVSLEEDIKEKVDVKPLGKVTYRDVTKGVIGALIGTVAHFAFLYGREIAKDISNTRASVLYAFSYVLLVVLMYRTGYREVKEKRYLELFPLRASIIYAISLVVIIFVFILYNQVEIISFGSLYREVSVVSILAVLGAGAADMIGRD